MGKCFTVIICLEDLLRMYGNIIKIVLSFKDYMIWIAVYLISVLKFIRKIAGAVRTK